MHTVIWDKLLTAIALVLIIEGLWPFISPARWRNALIKMVSMDDRSLRLVALVSMAIGLLILHVLTYY